MEVNLIKLHIGVNLIVKPYHQFLILCSPKVKVKELVTIIVVKYKKLYNLDLNSYFNGIIILRDAQLSELDPDYRVSDVLQPDSFVIIEESRIKLPSLIPIDIKVPLITSVTIPNSCMMFENITKSDCEEKFKFQDIKKEKIENGVSENKRKTTDTELRTEEIKNNENKKIKSEIESKCGLCKIATNENKLAKCTKCSSVFHIYCLRPPMSRVPRSKWYCRNCTILEIKDTILADTICSVCGKTVSRSGWLLHCSKCNNNFHRECTACPLQAIGMAWVCDDCSMKEVDGGTPAYNTRRAKKFLSGQGVPTVGPINVKRKSTTKLKVNHNYKKD